MSYKRELYKPTETSWDTDYIWSPSQREEHRIRVFVDTLSLHICT